MSHNIEQTARRWSQSKTRASLEDRVVYLAPVVTVAGLTAFVLFLVNKFSTRLASHTQG